MGWLGNQLFMEIHKPVLDTEMDDSSNLTNLTRILVAATEQHSASIDWADAERLFQMSTGLPMTVKMKVTNETESPTLSE
jgi:hypothetical protein